MPYDALTDAYVLFTEADGYAEMLHDGQHYYWISGSQGQAWSDFHTLGNFYTRELLPVTGLVDAAVSDPDFYPIRGRL